MKTVPGVAARAEVAQAQTQLSQTEAHEIDLGVQRAQLEHAIAVLTGRVPEGFHVAFSPLMRTPPPVPRILEQESAKQHEATEAPPLLTNLHLKRQVAKMRLDQTQLDGLAVTERN